MPSLPARRAFFSTIVAAAAALALPVQAQTPAPSGFVPLFDGTIDKWTVENTQAGNFTVRDGVLRVTGPQGWLRSKAQYGDFALRIEVRFLTDDADSGVFLRAPDPPTNVFLRGWPANAYQVQLRDMSRNKTTNPIWIANLYRHRIAPGETTYDGDAAMAAVKPTGEWQLVEIAARADRLTVHLNGALVTRAANIIHPRGHIGIQGEAGVVEYRTIGVREE
jgi:hypothetical protein